MEKINKEKRLQQTFHFFNKSPTSLPGAAVLAEFGSI